MGNRYKISKQYYNTNWKDLKLTDASSAKWDEGISIVQDRFESRFFKHIDEIKDDGFSGFVIMSISCLLIETLMQFYTGHNSTEDNPSYRGNQWKSFRDFLKNSPHFNTYFTTNKICRVFYRHFRCGLLHQAQTKEESKIKICTGNLISHVDSTIENGLIVDREIFYTNLKLEFEDYIRKLSNNEMSFNNENLREKCILKMDTIC